MLVSFRTCFLAGIAVIGSVGSSGAQPAEPQPPSASAPVSAPAPGGAAAGATPAGDTVLLFATGTATLGAQNEALLDKAARIYAQDRPVIMIVTGSTDRVGSPVDNLLLSQRRATMVVHAMIARGIPADRTQILAKGETNPPVSTARGVAQAENRRVEITWR